MRKINVYTLLVVVSFLFCSCSKTNIDGKWSDNIKLSTKSAVFSARGDSLVITTKGEWWWISSIAVDGEHYFGFGNEIAGKEAYTIINGCYVVERRNKHTLFIKVDENPREVQRKVMICLQAGDYFDSVQITQKPKSNN